MKKGKEKEMSEIILDDSYVTAVFAAENSRSHIKLFEIQPFLKTPNEVAWRISGVGIMQVLEKIYADTPTPVNSFIKAIKEIRSTIFLFKQLGGREK